MKWPWEAAIDKRVDAAIEERGYGDLILAGLEATVAGTTPNILRTSALETAARIWSDVLSAATVEGTTVLTKRVRRMIGRQLVRNGESLFVIDVEGGRVRIYPAADWEVRAGWSYRVSTIQPPGGSKSQTYSPESVLHFMWETEPREPWKGVSPLGSANLLSKLAANSENKLQEEAGGPSALILPIPDDGDSPAAKQLRKDLAGAKGKAVLAESTTAGWDDEQKGTSSDWKAQRLGPMIPEEMVTLYGDVLGRVLSACGIPPSLGGAGQADGTRLREDYRRFVMMTVEPMADMIAEEASEKLEEEISFDFRNIWAHDIAGRASAYAKLRSAEMSDADARAVSGL